MSRATKQPALAGLQTIAERERLLLAPYAQHSIDSQGRRYPLAEHPYRGPYQRDRDRVVHSAAFRRLSGKMQVFTGDMGDYHRTRMTHTQEVASIARTIGRALRLNEDLIEALALLHDIGHPPFGHAGEQTLDECLRDEGGFSHNRQALTIADQLERRYAAYVGLNLTRETLEGQGVRSNDRSVPPPLMETQVVDIADGITYAAHDTDDAVKLGLVKLPELEQIPLLGEELESLPNRSDLPPATVRKTVVHALIDRLVTGVLHHSGQQLARQDLQDAHQARQSGIRIGPGDELAKQQEQLQQFLYHRVYRHPKIVEVREIAQTRLHVMFDGYVQQPELLPPRYRKRAEQVGLPRSVGDYLAGMTDRFCESQFHRHFAGRSGQRGPLPVLE